LLGAFALVATLLAGAGVYGALAHSVGQRRRELGVRMALGARRNSLSWMVVRQGLKPAIAGLGLGLLTSLGANRVLRGFLYEVEPSDPITLAAVSLLFLAVAFGACLLPARSATGVDPVSVLNTE
jgi:ABC-type antimicrobial peptide transport system permease subunit